MAEKKLSVEVGQIVEETLDELTLEGKSKVKDRGRTIASSDIKKGTEPEAFTEDKIINRVFDLLDLKADREKKFEWVDKQRAVDYVLTNKEGDKFLLEAKKLNANLTGNSKSSAVNQIKQIFKLDDAQEYEFGIATDGLKWIIINKDKEIVDQLDLEKDIYRLQELLQGERKPVSEKKQEEITDQFYQWYDALLHGGKYQDRKGETKHIAEEDAFVNNIYSAKDKDKPEIAQTVANRLIFIKFLQSKGIIQHDVLQDLSELEESQLNQKMQELFFQVMNTPEDERVNISDDFEHIPYLNGSLFKRNEAEQNNLDYQIKYDILVKFIEFLDGFAFVNEESLEEKEAIDPKILGYIFERAMNDAERKSTGAYYTPRAVTHHIAENTVYPNLLEKANEYLKEEKGYKEGELYDSVDEMIRKCGSLWDIRQEILVEDFRVVDPACGSGAFLLSVANILWDIHKRIAERIGDNYSDSWLKKLILKNNIYGVDINHNATEIARLRLWLWLVDSFDRNNLDALPNIDYKIVSGNTLAGFVDITQMKEDGRVSGQNNFKRWEEENIPELFRKKNEKTTRYEEITGDEADEIKEEIERLDDRINRLLDDYYITWAADNGNVDLDEDDIEDLQVFHWGAEFSRVFDPEKSSSERGFDVIVGNPPYVSIQEVRPEQPKLVELLDDLKYYETPYYKYDIAIPFVERTQELMNQKGQLGFIMTKKWLKTRYGQKLKKKLKEERSVSKVIDFTDQQVFKGVTTYTIILFLNKKQNDFIRYARINEIGDNLRDKLAKVDQDIDTEEMKAFDSTYKTLDEDTWSFVEKTQAEILDSEEDDTLQDYANIFQGIITGRKSVFILDLIEEKENTYVGKSEALEREVELEKELCKPLIKGKEIEKWKTDVRDKIVLYPYEIYEEDGERQAKLIEKEELQQNYLQAWSYIKANEEELKSREGGKWKDKEQWHAHTRVRFDNIESFLDEKSMIPSLSNRSKMSYDDGDDYIFVGGGNGGGYGISLRESTELSYEYLTAIMNSRLLEWMVQTTSSEFEGNSYSYGKQYIKDLPIPTGEHRDTIRVLAQDIIKLVEESRESLSEEINTLENTIDFLTYEMYFDSLDSDLLAIVNELEDLDAAEKAKKLQESQSVEDTVSKIKNNKKVKIVDKGKLRDRTW